MLIVVTGQGERGIMTAKAVLFIADLFAVPVHNAITTTYNKSGRSNGEPHTSCPLYHIEDSLSLLIWPQRRRTS